jgi:hypothetical protein
LAKACDLCSVYTAGMARGETSGWFTGVSEQFTRYDDLREEGHRVSDDGGQYLDSSITQLFVGYGFSDRFALQINLPYIHRSFKRPEGDAIDRGTVSGIGDMAAVAQYTIVRHYNEDSNWLWRVLGGVTTRPRAFPSTTAMITRVPLAASTDTILRSDRDRRIF